MGLRPFQCFLPCLFKACGLSNCRFGYILSSGRTSVLAPSPPQRIVWYCGWTKSCTTLKPWDTIVCWYLQHESLFQRVLGGAGFCPSTVFQEKPAIQGPHFLLSNAHPEFSGHLDAGDAAARCPHPGDGARAYGRFVRWVSVMLLGISMPPTIEVRNPSKLHKKGCLT